VGLAPLALIAIAVPAWTGSTAAQASAARDLATSCAEAAGGPQVVVADGAAVTLGRASSDPRTISACLARAAGVPSDADGAPVPGRWSNWTVTRDDRGNPVLTSTLGG
jgi:hypothetical protein